MNIRNEYFKNYWLLITLLGTVSAVLGCARPEQGLSYQDERLESKFSQLASSLGQLDSPMVKSPEYQVVVNSDTLDVWQETCYDLAQNGGQTDVHTALFKYVPGTQVKIICNSSFSNFTLSPKRLNIPVVKNGNELTFTIPEYYNYALDSNPIKHTI